METLETLDYPDLVPELAASSKNKIGKFYRRRYIERDKKLPEFHCCSEDFSSLLRQILGGNPKGFLFLFPTPKNQTTISTQKYNTVSFLNKGFLLTILTMVKC